MKITRTINAIFIMAITAMLCVACNKDEEMDELSMLTTKGLQSTDGMTVLGKQFEDPYNIQYMAAAFEQLKGILTFPFNTLPPTGQYIRILANSTSSWDFIESDTTTIWFDYPLDYEIETAGTYYHDPEYPDSVVWKYGVVPMNYEIPSSITRNHFYDVFIPDDYPDYKEYEAEFDKLEDLAFELSGFVDEDAKDTKASSKWYPSATIRTYDDVVNGFVNLQGVKVVAKQGSKTCSEITNAQGKCTMSKQFKTKKNVKFSIMWERNYWDIRRGKWCQARSEGPALKNAWTYNIPHGTIDEMYAAMHRALLKCYYGNILGLDKPITTVGRLKLSYYHEEDVNEGMTFNNWCRIGVRPDIMIWGYLNGVQRNPSDIISRTFHELGHMIHRQKFGRNELTKTHVFIADSWARAVQCELTNHYYNNDLSVSYACPYTEQTWTPADADLCHTPIFIDLIDTHNQVWENANRPNDEISGYTIKEIQDSLLERTYLLDNLSYHLKSHKLHGTTDAQIDTLLAKYYSVPYFNHPPILI